MGGQSKEVANTLPSPPKKLTKKLFMKDLKDFLSE
jgi:hypothetical protein